MEPTSHPVPPEFKRLQGSAPALDSSAEEACPQVPLLLKCDEVARLLGLGRTKTFQLMSTGELPVVRIGSCARVPRAMLDSWIAERTSRRTRPVDRRSP